MWPLLLVIAVAAHAREFTEDDHYRLPRLFHLDNFERCLAQPQARYCTGTLRLKQDKPSALYKFIQDYASVPRNFDRTLIHRGYCLSTRCPTSEPNLTLHFEQCVEKHALYPGLKASVESYSCKTSKDLNKEKEMDLPQKAFLVVVGVFLFLNAVGTLYDIGLDGKNRLLLAWSMRMNWQRLVDTHEDGDPRLTALAPIQGVRVLLLALVMITHGSEILHRFYLYNPEYLEHALTYPVTMLIRNGSSLVQAFFVISNFLFAYSLLLHAKTRQLGLKQLPLCILQRVARLSPIHLLGVGFAATWWKASGDGPQWGVLAAESDICRKKFWAHAFYVHNFVNHDEHCLLQTWFLAVDMQLFVIASILMLYLMQKKQNPIPILTALFFGSCLLNGVLAYIYEWKPMLYIMVPENIRNTFRGIPSFNQFYITPWSSLPACFLGLLLAHVHFNMQEQGYKISKHKWFVRLYHLAIPLHAGWILAGTAVLRHEGRAAAAAYATVERPGFALLAALVLLGLANNIDGSFRRLTAWRGWAAMGRLSLCVLTLHWLVNVRLVAGRRTLSEISILSIGGDVLSTSWWTHLAALPLAILVEAPVQRSLTALLA